MNSDTAFVFFVIGAAACLMASNRVRYDLVALIVVLALVLGEILTVGEALAGFGSSVVVLVACLLVVGEMLERTGVARSVGNMILRYGGADETRLLVLLMLSAAFLGSVMSSTAVVAIFVPIILRVALETGIDQSRLLLPMSYAALISGMLTLIATTPNLVVSDELAAHDFEPLGFFSFFPLGFVILLVAIVYMLFLGRRLLSSDGANPSEEKTSPTYGVLDIWRTYAVSGRVDVFEVTTNLETSDVEDIRQTGMRFLARRRRDRKGVPVPVIFRDGMALDVRDHVLVSGDSASLDALAQRPEFTRVSALSQDTDSWLGIIGPAEVLVHPEASVSGETPQDALSRWSEDLVPLGLVRDGKPIPEFEATPLRSGDRLLIGGPWSKIDEMTRRHDEFVLLRVPRERKEVPPALNKFAVSLAILAGMVLLSALNLVSVTVAVLMAAIAAVLFRTLSAEDAYRSISLSTLVLIAGMLPLADALETTGGSDMIVGILLDVVGQSDPRLMMAALFLLTAVLGLVLSNTASAVLVAPIAIVAAETLQVSPYPFCIAVLIAASAAFSTPVSTPVVTLVVAPGGYRFADFLKVGLPLTFIVALVTILLAPLLFPF